MRRKLAIGAVLVAVVAAAASTYAWAAGGAVATQTLNACVDRDGQLRLVAIAGDCKKAETPLSWNTVGPSGATGAQGIPGRDGLTGPQGPAGVSGSNPPEPDSVAGTAAITGQQGPFSAITLTGISHEIVSPRDPASGLSSGNRQHKPLTITKEIDKATPLLMRAMVNNETLTSVLIGLLRNGQQIATVKLTDAKIVDYAAHGLTETWSLTYKKIEWTEVDSTITVQDDWVANT